MSDEQNTTNQVPEDNHPFSQQPTSMVEATLAETLGLSMHNAITNQQSAQMTTSASITNACARLLQTPTHLPASTQQTHAAPQAPPAPLQLEQDADIEDVEPEKEVTPPPPQKKRFNLFNFLGKKPKESTDNE